MDAADLVRRYYDALDAREYGALEEVLASDFVQRRPDRAFEGRDAFVRFMRDDRPNPNTRHAVDAIVDGGERVAVRGRVLDESSTERFEFADFFEVAGDRIVRLETYSR